MTQFCELADAGEDGTTTALEVPRPMGAYIDAWGTWDGAAVALERSVDTGATFHAIGIEISADGGAQALDLPQGHYRLALAGAGAATSVSALFEVPDLPPV